MSLHGGAALTLKQRTEVRRLHREEGISIRKLAQRFGVNPSTIQVWTHRDCPLDRSAAPHHPRRTVTSTYRAAVMACRKEHPAWGPIRIAAALKGDFPQADRGTVYSLLRQEQLTRPQRPKREPNPIPVGRHRVQLDIQQLPAIEGGKGFEYKISMIHLRTRLKYSEIHPEATAATVAEVLQRGLERLPPFFSSSRTTP